MHVIAANKKRTPAPEVKMSNIFVAGNPSKKARWTHIEWE